MNGFLLVDKPTGWTSHDVVAKVRGLARLKKVGHAGTLDPMATGLLVLGLGNATRLLRFVQGLPKEYDATALLGVATDTLDADGAVLEREPMPVTADEVTAVLDRFRGPILQTPPMVSARKVGGRRLYELARAGETVEREARPITIHELELTDFAPSDYPEASFRVVCSTGTYIRTLADDIAAALGGRAHLVSLRRVRNGSLNVSDATTMEELTAAAEAEALGTHVVPAARALSDLPAVTVAAELVAAIGNGRRFESEMLDIAPGLSGLVRVLDPAGELLAVSSVTDGRVAPEVVLPR
ncbi:MAG: tRNA pseudouridine(55) synthase TruB [bacterium]|nr:tRNA pseudouridine(55) synthase TruB [bacterium]